MLPMAETFDSQAAIQQATEAVAIAVPIIATAARLLAEHSEVDGKVSVAKLDLHQVLAYELAHGASAVEGSKVMTFVMSGGFTGDLGTGADKKEFPKLEA